jgi:hypothetical protein
MLLEWFANPSPKDLASFVWTLSERFWRHGCIEDEVTYPGWALTCRNWNRPKTRFDAQLMGSAGISTSDLVHSKNKGTKMTSRWVAKPPKCCSIVVLKPLSFFAFSSKLVSKYKLINVYECDTRGLQLAHEKGLL